MIVEKLLKHLREELDSANRGYDAYDDDQFIIGVAVSDTLERVIRAVERSAVKAKEHDGDRQ